MEVELRHIRAFLSVARNFSYTRAAEEMNLSQPAVTRAIQALETTLGTRLLERDTRSVTLRPVGEDLLGRLAPVVAALDNVLDSAVRSGLIRLGFAWILPQPWARESIRSFEERTQASVDILRVDNVVEELEHGSVDVAVHRGDCPASPAIRSVSLGHEARIAAVSDHSELASLTSIHWRAFSELELVVNEINGTTGQSSWPEGRGPRGTVHCQSFDAWLENVAINRGVGVVPESAKHRASHPHVRFLPIREAPPVEVLLLYRAQGDPLADLFVEEATTVATGMS